uniref:Glycosyltransferase involved in cell wall bisynthesis n=1 Tax=Candidatus Kentrum sp. UNK TaxID=2126344 RepID=A0A451AJI0_9GAMM|nr:MAG: Glycosyltransferase involved in cell wall bisynthesis [Candidatus Kentron sp. UNK]VFK70966.1 MAG: Glycosyltransferase involved in cell wall bisynthesis [Candidatus Kentron sp. UNK]
MKIAIDAHSLGQKKDNISVAVYARNLSFGLMQLGHEVFPIYSMNRIIHKEQLMAPTFFQALVTKGEPDAKNYKRWLLYTFKYAFSHLPFLSPRIKTIQGVDGLDLQSMREKLPMAAAGFLNTPSLYRAAQAIAALTRVETSVMAPKEQPIDVLHLTMPLPVRIKKAKKIVTVHDMIPLKIPNVVEVNLGHYLNVMETSLRTADLIFSVSRHTKNDLMEKLNIPDKKIFVTYQSSIIPNDLLELERDEVARFLAQYYGLGIGKYFLFYGNIDPKKNIGNLLRAFGIAKTDCKLVIVGGKSWLSEDVERFFESKRYNQESQQKFIRIPHAFFHSLMYLLKGARALLFPSIYEGFGLPVLEAMQMGTPVITSNVSSLPEVGGDAAYYVDPYSIESIKTAIETLSDNEKKLEEMSQKGLLQADKFSLENHKNRISQGYELLFA